MKGARDQVEVAEAQVLAPVKQEMVGAVGATAARGWRHASRRTAKLEALAVDRPRTLDGDVLRVDREEQTYVPIAESRVARERDAGRAVLFAVGAAKQFALCLDPQRYVAFQLHGA